MSDQPDLPALSDDELRETLDRLASLALNLSDQVEDQTKAINRATTAANEARRAAVTVQSQNDPAGFGDRIGQAVEARLLDTLQRLDRTVNHLDLRTNKTAAVLDQASEDRGNLLRNIRDREERLERWKSYWSLVRSGCARSGFGDDRRPAPFLSQHPLHMRCPRGDMDGHNRGRQRLRVLPALNRIWGAAGQFNAPFWVLNMC
jgi:hypothetical protein